MKALRKLTPGQRQVALVEWEVALANLRAKQGVKALIHPNEWDW